MEHWKRVSIMVTIFTFSLEVQPLDSFLTAYLTDWKVNATLDEVSNLLTPININFGVLGAFLVILFSDYLKYKPVMMFCCLMGVAAYVCLINSSATIVLIVAQVCLSLLKCVDTSYYGYLFAVVRDKEHYQIATGYATAGAMSGMCASGLLGQLVVYLNSGDYATLPYYSLAGVAFASVWVCFLPAVERKKNLHVEYNTAAVKAKANVFSKTVIHDPEIPKYCTKNVVPENVGSMTGVKKLIQRFYGDITYLYTDFEVLRWSCWHVISTCGIIQINLYIDILFTYIMEVSGNKNMLLNGLVDSLATMSAAIGTYKIGKINVDWTRHGDTFLAVCGLTLGLLMCLCYYFKSIILVYILYICFQMLVQSVLVIVISQIGTQVKNDCYTLVLGCNSFLGMVLAMASSIILTCVGTSIPGHFLVYGGAYTALGIGYGCTACFKTKTAIKHFNRLP